MSDEFIFYVDLEENGGPLGFSSFPELQGWLSTEISAWDGLTPNSNTFKKQTNHLATLTSEANQNSHPDLQRAFCQRAESLIKEAYKNQKSILSTSVKGRFVMNLIDRDRLIGTGALAYFISHEIPPNSVSAKIREGEIEAILFEKGIAGINDKREQTEDLIKTLQENIFKLDKSTKSANEEALTNIERIRAAGIEASQKANTLIDDHDKEFKQTIKNGQEELSNIALAYDRHMATKASVNYWEARKKHHKDTALKFLIAASILLITAAAGMYGFLDHLSAIDSAHFAESKKHLSPLEIPVWYIPTTIALVTIFVWLQRILVRIILSNLHLETDAGERIVMTKTYIAMLREGQTLKDEDRKLILASLFRPSTTGIMSDDALPFNLDAMQKIVGSGK